MPSAFYKIIPRAVLLWLIAGVALDLPALAEFDSYTNSDLQASPSGLGSPSYSDGGYPPSGLGAGTPNTGTPGSTYGLSGISNEPYAPKGIGERYDSAPPAYQYGSENPRERYDPLESDQNTLDLQGDGVEMEETGRLYDRDGIWVGTVKRINNGEGAFVVVDPKGVAQYLVSPNGEDEDSYLYNRYKVTGPNYYTDNQFDGVSRKKRRPLEGSSNRTVVEHYHQSWDQTDSVFFVPR